MGALIDTAAGRLRTIGFMPTITLLALLELLAVGYAASNLIAATNLKMENTSVAPYVSPVKIVRTKIS